MSFRPANIKNLKEINTLFQEQLALLNASIANNTAIEDALEGKKQGIVPTTPLPVSREERLNDNLFQQKKALENLTKILGDAVEAGRAIANMDIGDMILLNRNAPFIMSDYSSKFTDTDADFFLKYFKQLISSVASNKGLINAMIPKASVSEKRDEFGEVDENWDLGELKSYKFPAFMNKPIRANASQKSLKKQSEDLQQLEYDLLSHTSYIKDMASPEAKEGQKIIIRIRKRIDEVASLLTGTTIDTASLYGAPSTNPFDLMAQAQEDDEEDADADDEDADEDADEDEDAEDEDVSAVSNLGRGFQVTRRMPTQRIILGRGLTLTEPEPRYVGFGKFIIHYQQLKNNTLNIKYKSMGGVPQIPTAKISTIFRNFLLDLLDNKKISTMGLSMLNDKEKKYFKKIIIFSQLDRQLGVTKDDDSESEEEDEMKMKLKRWELVKGQYLAGNNADSVKHKLIRMVYDFTINGQISKEEGEEILLSLF